jgi:transcriptional regulator with XRE-family HTH domain
MLDSKMHNANALSQPNRTLRLCRLASEMTQEDLAQRAGIHHTTVSRIETGRSRPQRRVAERIGAAIGVDPAAIFPEVLDG